jgi:hypothetical protein
MKWASTPFNSIVQRTSRRSRMRDVAASLGEYVDGARGVDLPAVKDVHHELGVRPQFVAPLNSR